MKCFGGKEACTYLCKKIIRDEAFDPEEMKKEIE